MPGGTDGGARIVIGLWKRASAAIAAGAAVLVVIGACASPASAIIVRLPSGKLLSYQALSSSSTPGLSHHEATLSNLDYSGGPVMQSNVNYVIDWQPLGYGGTTYQGVGSQNVVNGVAQFFKDLQAASGSTANSDSISTQYNDAQGHTAAYSSQLGSGGSSTLNGAYLDSDPLPSNGCSEGTYCITDAQIQAELANFIAANSLPSGDLIHEYFLLTPPSVVSCIDAAGTACSANARDQSSQIFCGYHSASTASSQFLYADIPDLAELYGCDPYFTTGICATPPPATIGNCFFPNNDYADGIVSTVSHEHNESITDPEPNNAWTDYQQCAKGASETCGGEIGDKCSGDEGQDNNSQYPLSLGFLRPYNEVINGTGYWLQMEWSNQGHGCADSVSQLGGLSSAPGSSFTVKGDPTNALTDTFDATASGSAIAHYVWQFNDNTQSGQPPQNTTIETSSPTVSHAFPAAGKYTVALTTIAANGRTAGSAVQTVAAGLTQAAFSASTSTPTDASPAAFDGSATSHDPNVGISSYSWNFGDGTPAGSGVTTSHTFAPGSYTVSVAVTDTLGRVSTASQSLTVADLTPTVTFSVPSGHALIPVSFTGKATDDEAMSSYKWTFGDGSSASAAAVSHAFRKQGRYLVTVTATDPHGLFGSFSHVVVIGPVRCVVPSLSGAPLGAARAALGVAQCRAGAVSQPRRPTRKAPRHKRWVLVVSHTSIRAGSVKPRNTKVKLFLTYRAV